MFSSSPNRLRPPSIVELLEPYFPGLPESVAAQLSTYLELLLKWNALTNLTAIRDPAEIVRRHFGESLFAARHMPRHARTLLDLGSGAGFPGLPIQMVFPELAVTLAESQGKKAAFLREAVRTLSLQTRVYAERAEKLAGLTRFDVVTMRAVDDPTAAETIARRLVASGGTILHLTTQQLSVASQGQEDVMAREQVSAFRVPESERRLLTVLRF